MANIGDSWRHRPTAHAEPFAEQQQEWIEHQPLTATCIQALPWTVTESAVPPPSRFRRVQVETTDAAARSVIPQLPGPRLHRCLITIVILFYFFPTQFGSDGRTQREKKKKRIQLAAFRSGDIVRTSFTHALQVPASLKTTDINSSHSRAPLHQLLTIFVFSLSRLLPTYLFYLSCVVRPLHL